MGEYLHPEETKRFYTSKFLRVGKTIVTTGINDTLTKHRSLAEQNQIAQEIEALRVTDPSQVDGGQYSREGQSIRLHSDSTDFKLPVKGFGARNITAQLFRSRSPEFTVTIDEYFQWTK
ncbi:hypothetical protein HZB78_04520 [Candidatus Collierbacteria bacterium]|nr:hypothetical protein [Candidatus Collierbacteria bacterium]